MMAGPQKTCSRCKQCLPLSAFTNAAQSPDGKHSWCKVCKRKYARKHNQTPYAKRQARGVNLRRNYGITAQDYDELYDQQKGMCLLCGTQGERTGLRDGLTVDHDHRTGKIRGLLCNKCNRGLGLLGDNVVVLQRAARYLEFHNGR